MKRKQALGPAEIDRLARELPEQDALLLATYEYLETGDPGFAIEGLCDLVGAGSPLDADQQQRLAALWAESKGYKRRRGRPADLERNVCMCAHIGWLQDRYPQMADEDIFAVIERRYGVSAEAVKGVMNRTRRRLLKLDK